MKLNIKSAVVKMLSLIAVSATMFSFSGKKGGDSFEIYLNKKLVLQQYVSQSNGVKNIQLDGSMNDGQLDIYYSHCGKTGTARNISIKDAKNNVLKEWKFADVNGAKTSMGCKARDILNLHKNNSADNLFLFYSSKEIPKGRLLASIIVARDYKTSP